MVKMVDCNICKIVDNEVESKKVYEDDSLLAILHPKPAAPGHIVLIPKEHFPIFENIPNGLVIHMFNIASKISASIFTSINAQGTNIFMQNGVPAGQNVPHAVVHIIPRAENDGVSLEWDPKTLDLEEMSTIELKLKEETKGIIVKEESDQPVVVTKKEIQPHFEGDAKPEGDARPEGDTKKDDENYLLKQLERMP